MTGNSNRLLARQGLSLLIGLVSLGVTLLSCTRHRQQQGHPNTLAEVNGEMLLTTDFERELGSEVRLSESDLAFTPEQISVLKKNLLDNWINQTLLLQEARRINLGVSQEEVERRLLQMGKDFPKEHLQQSLAENALSWEELRPRVSRLIRMEKLMVTVVYPRVGVTEAELHAFYDAHREDFQEPERIHVLQIVVKTYEEAKRLSVAIRQGKSFPELARKYSLSADAQLGGDLGVFSRGVMPLQFDEIAFKLGPNQVSEVTSSDYGFHLFKLLDRYGPHIQAFPEARRRVEAKVLKAKRSEAEKTFTRFLRTHGNVLVNDQAFQSAQAPVKKEG